MVILVKFIIEPPRMGGETVAADNPYSLCSNNLRRTLPFERSIRIHGDLPELLLVRAVSCRLPLGECQEVARDSLPVAESSTANVGWSNIRCRIHVVGV